MSIPLEVRVDSKGRLTIPRHVRGELSLEPGMTFFLHVDGESLTFARGENPFVVLAKKAERDYYEGRTRSLDEVIAEIELE